MSSIQTDRLQLVVGVDTRAGINQLGYLQAEYKKLEEAKKTATSYTQELALNNAMSVMKEKIEAARKELGLLGLSQKELNRKIAEHNREAANRYAIGSEQAKQHKAEAQAIRDVVTAEQRDIATIRETIKVNGIRGLTTQQLINYSKQLQEELMKESDLTSDLNKKRIKESTEVESLISSRKATARGASPIFGNLKDGLKSAFVGGVGGAVASMALDNLSAAFDKIGQKIDQLAKKSDAISDLELAFQTTTEEAEALNKELIKIDTRTKNPELRNIATQGGLLNVPKEELRGFVEAADQAVVVMQKDFPGGVEETTTKLGKLKQLFAETKDLSFGEAITRDASAIKTLADNGTATAGSMTEFALTMGQLPPVLRPTLTQTLGLGAAFEEAGFNATTAATNLTKTLLVSANNTDKVANFFGKTRKEVEQLINTKPNEFLLELAQRLSKLSGTELAKTLDTLKLSDTQVVEVLGILGTQLDNVREKQEMASKAFLEGSRITDAFNVKNNNFAANLEKLSKNWNNFISESAIGKAFQNMTSSIVDGLNKLLATEKDINKQFDDQTNVVRKLDGQVKPLLEKYDKLSKDKSAESQKELKNVIGQIITIMPNASFQVDQYGNAISVNTQKTREFIEQQRAMLQIINKDLISKTAKDNQNARKELRELSAEINRVQTLPRNKDGKFTELKWDITGSKVIVYDLAEMNKRAEQLRNTANSTFLAWKGFKGEMTETKPTTPTGTPPPSGLPPFIPSDKEISDAKKLQEEVAKNEAKLIDEIVKMKIDMIDDENDQKKAQLHDAYLSEKLANEQLVKDRKLSQSGFDAWLKAATEKLGNDVAEIEEKAREKQEKADLEAAQQTAKLILEAKLAKAEAAGDELLILESKIALRKQQFDVDIEKATADQKLSVWEKYLADVQKLQDDAQYKNGQNEAKGASKLASMIKRGTQLYIKELDEAEKLMLDFGKSTQEALFSIVDSRFQRQEMRQDKSLDRQQRSLEKQLNDGLITEDEYEKRKTGIEKRHELEVAKIRRKQAIAEKANALASIAINTAIGASKVLGQTGMFGIPAVAFVIAQGAMQAATVLAQPLPALPALFSGGWTPDQGTIPVNDGLNGMLGILHPKEFVLNAKATSSPVFAAIRPILESANAGQSITSMSGGGAGPVAGNNANFFGDLGEMLRMNMSMMDKMDKRLANLKVYFGGSDYEHIGEEINYQSGINDDAMIYNSKL
ncbi:hypothetical protein GCM10027035_47790 [Emticicia sediminis]